jgi:hypothetical protein
VQRDEGRGGRVGPSTAEPANAAYLEATGATDRAVGCRVRIFDGDPPSLPAYAALVQSCITRGPSASGTLRAAVGPHQEHDWHCPRGIEGVVIS